MFKIYPGPSIWLKRIMYTVVLSSAGINLFINTAQNHLFDMTQTLALKVDSLLPSASGIAGTLEYAVPVLQKIESSTYADVAKKYEIPQSKDLTAKIKAVKELQHICNNWEISLGLIIKILKYTGVFMWFPIWGAFWWLYLDIKRGRSKIFTIICLIVAMVINIKSYEYLSLHFSNLIT